MWRRTRFLTVCCRPSRNRPLVRPVRNLVRSLHRGGSFLRVFCAPDPTGPGTPGATTFLFSSQEPSTTVGTASELPTDDSVAPDYWHVERVGVD